MQHAVTTPDPQQRSRRNVWLALAHFAAALAILGFFVWSQAHR